MVPHKQLRSRGHVLETWKTIVQRGQRHHSQSSAHSITGVIHQTQDHTRHGTHPICHTGTRVGAVSAGSLGMDAPRGSPGLGWEAVQRGGAWPPILTPLCDQGWLGGRTTLDGDTYVLQG